MSETHYCWRCKIDVPLLNEAEWLEIEPLLRSGIKQIKDYRGQTHASIVEALENNQGLPVLLKYREMTGYSESNINAVWHHRRRNFGDPCPDCGKLLRTPRAKMCPECGYAKSDV